MGLRLFSIGTVVSALIPHCWLRAWTVVACFSMLIISTMLISVTSDDILQGLLDLKENDVIARF